MRQDLSKYDLIIARESVSYEVLKNINNNVLLLPDPAFSLKKAEEPLPAGLTSNTYVGINVSPMVQSNERNVGITLNNYHKLIQHILNTTNDHIALIPHVVWDHNDDRIPLKNLYKEYSETGRVILIDDQNCKSLKNVISNCRLFVGARTHSTIAAYSSKVPTLVVGYSNKAKGIAKDLFGSYENYVLPVQSLESEDDLTNAYKWLEENRELIKDIYDSKMDKYIGDVNRYSTILETL